MTYHTSVLGVIYHARASTPVYPSANEILNS